MRIRKKEPSVGILGKIVNTFSSSKQDTYSCNEINKIPMKVLPTNANIDEILDNGNFAIFNAKGTLPSGLNLDDNNVFVESNLWYSDYGVQTLKSVRSQERWIRHRSNGVWEEWSFENRYSTEETFTGKYWIDGKKIYRKVFQLESTGPTTLITDITSLKISRVIKLKGIETWDNYSGFVEVPYNNGDTDYTRLWMSNNRIRLQSSYTSRQIWVIFEYTKTTD